MEKQRTHRQKLISIPPELPTEEHPPGLERVFKWPPILSVNLDWAATWAVD